MAIAIPSSRLSSLSIRNLKRSRSLGTPAKHTQQPDEQTWPKTPPPLPHSSMFSVARPPLPCRANKRTKYSVALHDRGSQAEITLNVYNSKAAAVFPIYMGGETISGNVELKIGRSMEIQEVLVSARGRLVKPGKNGKAFVQVFEGLWAAGVLDNDACRKARGNVPSAQLTGSFSWPFSIKLPGHLPGSSEMQEASILQKLPPTFSSHDLVSSIQYDILVIVKSHKEISLSSPFIYTPITRPPPLPPLRAFAYEENAPLLGPQVDVDGWEVFPSFVIRGVAFTAYTVDIRCTLALAKPLSYARGSVIPCLLTIESSDLQILQLLYKPSAPRFRLCRRVESSAGIEKIAKILDVIKQPCRVVSNARWALMDNIHSHEDFAVQPITDAMYTRTLSGELYLPENMTPSFSFGKMSLKYAVQLLSFDVAGFIPSDGENAVFFEHTVEVTSDYAEGTRPKAYLSYQTEASALRTRDHNTIYR